MTFCRYPNPVKWISKLGFSILKIKFETSLIKLCSIKIECYQKIRLVRLHLGMKALFEIVQTRGKKGYLPIKIFTPEGNRHFTL